VVPQPGSQTTAAVPTSSNQAPAMCSVSNEPRNSAMMPKTEKISNIDLLAGLDIAAGAVSTTVSNTKETPLVFTVADQKDPIKATTTIIAPKPGEQKEAQKFTPSAEQLKQEADKLQAIVAGLTQKTLQGTVPLDTYWKDVLESVEKSGKKLSVSVARCYPMKNRASDILPYDQSRVELKLLKDDYINASYMKGISPCSPDFIVSQLPVKGGLEEFLSLVWQEGIETVVSLVPCQDMEEGRFVPSDKDPLHIGTFIITQQSYKDMSTYRERVLTFGRESVKRALIHLEVCCWAGPDMPASPAPFLDVAQHVLRLYAQQRSPSKPILVHCRDGGNKSGTLCAITAALADIEGCGVAPDMVAVFSALVQGRKNIVRDRQYLGYALESVLFHLQSKLIQQGIISGVTGPAQRHSRHPSQDYINQSTPAAEKEVNPLILQSPSKLQNLASLLPAVNAERGPESEGVCTTTASSVLLAGVVSSSVVEPNGTDIYPPGDPNGTGVAWTESVSVSEASGTECAGSASSHLTELAQLEQLTKLELTDSPKKKRITKDDFINSTGNLQSNLDPADPLSQLNALWTMK